ncbi:MAG TPA: hypothetical protein VGQ83_25395 [Polyangia bacterium]|jgi:hypothetical protein
MGGMGMLRRATLAGALLSWAGLIAACSGDISSASSVAAADWVTSGFTGVQRGLQVTQSAVVIYQGGDPAQGLAQLHVGRQLISNGLGSMESGLGMTDPSGAVAQCRDAILAPLQAMQTGLEELNAALALLDAGGDAAQGLTHVQSGAAIVDRGQADMEGALMGCGLMAMGDGGM